MELIHTCYRIGDIDRSVAFYEALGFEELMRMAIRDEAINVFMGFRAMARASSSPTTSGSRSTTSAPATTTSR